MCWILFALVLFCTRCWCWSIKSILQYYNVEYLPSWYACRHAYIRLELWFLQTDGTPFIGASEALSFFLKVFIFFSPYKFCALISVKKENPRIIAKNSRHLIIFSLKIGLYWHFFDAENKRNDLKNIFAVVILLFSVRTHTHILTHIKHFNIIIAL